jgi:hypothetical protein
MLVFSGNRQFDNAHDIANLLERYTDISAGECQNKCTMNDMCGAYWFTDNNKNNGIAACRILAMGSDTVDFKNYDSVSYIKL